MMYICILINCNYWLHLLLFKYAMNIKRNDKNFFNFFLTSPDSFEIRNIIAY